MILASTSPQRKTLLKQILNHFTSISPTCTEVFDDTLSVYENTMNVAQQKADSVRINKPVKNGFILGADTVCYLDNKVVGKPVDYDDAYNMLMSYNNKTLQVITGVCIVHVVDDLVCYYKFYDESFVKFTEIEDSQVKDWLALDDYMDKSGAFAIQKNGYFDASFEGSMTNIIGLPVEKIKEVIKTLKGLSRYDIE